MSSASHGKVPIWRSTLVWTPENVPWVVKTGGAERGAVDGVIFTHISHLVFDNERRFGVHQIYLECSPSLCAVQDMHTLMNVYMHVFSVGDTTLRPSSYHLLVTSHRRSHRDCRYGIKRVLRQRGTLCGRYEGYRFVVLCNGWQWRVL
jgi:hypothetical protein